MSWVLCGDFLVIRGCSQEDIENFKAEIEKRQLSEENEVEEEKTKTEALEN